VSIPGIELVDVLDLAMALKLQVTGNLDCAEVGKIKTVFPEIAGTPGRGAAPGETLLSIQTLVQRSPAALQFFCRSKADMVRMSLEPIDLEYSRIFQPVNIRVHHKFLLLSAFGLFIFNYYDKRFFAEKQAILQLIAKVCPGGKVKRLRLVKHGLKKSDVAKEGDKYLHFGKCGGMIISII